MPRIVPRADVAAGEPSGRLFQHAQALAHFPTNMTTISKRSVPHWVAWVQERIGEIEALIAARTRPPP